MNPPELNGSSLFLEFGGRKGRPTSLTIFNEAASERPPYRSENGGWFSAGETLHAEKSNWVRRVQEYGLIERGWIASTFMKVDS